MVWPVAESTGHPRESGRGGYYSIPRRVSTKDLADELGISDRPVKERLRRAISRSVRDTPLLPTKADEHEKDSVDFIDARPRRMPGHGRMVGGPNRPRPVEDGGRQENGVAEGG